jgi:hypothetical protein
VAASELHPAILNGYERAWTAKVPVYAKALHQTVNGAFLDIHQAPENPQAQTNGVIFDVTPDEFQKLKAREHGYDWVDVQDKIAAKDKPQDLADDTPILTADFDDAKAIQPGDPDSFVFEQYVKTVQAGMKQQSKHFWNLFKQTTRPVTQPVLPGAYQWVG